MMIKEMKMIDRMRGKTLWPALGVFAVGLALTGCGRNTESGTAPDTSTTATSTTATTQAAGDDHAHAPGEAPHGHEGEGANAASNQAHGAEDQATVAKFFPGATLAVKPFPFSADAAAHLGDDAGVKFKGNENEWQVFEATRDGQRVGMAVMTHSALPDGKDMHIAFAVNPRFAVTHVTAVDAPEKAKMQGFVEQIVGKKMSAALKVGQDLKATSGLAPATAQIAADSVKKGLAILDSNFNTAHGHAEARSEGAHPAGAAHDESKPHAH
jgi:hypothetical protein